MDEEECICTRICDCQCPEPESEIALVSNNCPEHNLYPKPDDDCPAINHWFELGYIPGTEQNQLDFF